MTTKEYKAVIRNISRSQYVKAENNGIVKYTKSIDNAVCFYDEEDAESTLELLNETKTDCFVLLPVND